MTQEQWIARCATHYARHGHVADDVADDMARAHAEQIRGDVGADVSQWLSPESAASADIAGWTED